jgi:asparagine synthase (glutamine-hydrolysing)
MCGITGIITKNPEDFREADLKKMNELISHRGPDGEGFYVDGSVAFAHRRLAIIDLSPDGLQPMHYQDKYVITFNGEVYNYIEVRAELKSLGYSFRTKSDTEVILAAYDKWGTDCVNRFNGMWAFAIYDKKNKIVFCSRDRFGVKPFYYRTSEKDFRFGSEIKQLLKETNEANTDLITHYLLTGMHDHEDRTFFKGIYKLPPSHNLIYDLRTHSFKIERFYELTKKTGELDYKTRLEQAIQLRLRSDVKVGTCLSGGLDSSTVAAIASKLYQAESGEKFNAIHAKSIEKQTDESQYAIEVTNSANLDLHVTEPHPEDFKKVFDEVIYTQEEPFGSPSIYLQYFVMKKAAELGCKVMLDGQGGDETLLGYERYYAPVFATLVKEKGWIKAFSEAMNSRKNNSKMSLKNILKYIAGTFLINLRVRYQTTKVPLKKKYIPTEYSYFDSLKKEAMNLFNLQRSELFSTNLQALLRYEDKNSMRHAIETRLPFLDYRAVETALSLPVDRKVHQGWTKFVLREICASVLPPNVAWRKNKLGFNAPDKSWLTAIEVEAKNEIRNSKILNTLLETTDIKTLPISGNWNITWRLINIAAWERVYNVRLSAT